MNIGKTFQVDSITYSIVNVFRREVRVGTGVFNDSFPNAVNIAYNSMIHVPHFVVYSHKVWSVIEIGTCAFALCENISSVKIGYNVEVVAEKAFHRCFNIQSVIFEPHSRLKVLEKQAFYDLYHVKSIEFGGDSLEKIGPYVFGFNHELKSFRFPPSVAFLDFESLRGLRDIEQIDFCGKMEINKDVFNRDPKHAITSTGVKIKVTSKFPSKTFGKDDIVIIDNSINCVFPKAVEDFELQCRSHNNQCYYRLFNAVFYIFIVLIES